MRIVLLCGGAGKRLWPLSNDIRSKLFLRLLPAPDGQKESMLGRVYRQLTVAAIGM
ncbi:mannose-1-phosphate guanylyltransferase, partial [Paenibacillus sp. 28ISP30-2]|nr:mannose-1-phosphate guanylyltransferase [Paenibacillus sp. 28ISP30-2]